MGIKFISLNERFIQLVKEKGFEGHVMRIQDYQIDPSKKTYYVSPANSLCFMDGGIDYALKQEVKIILKDLGIKTKFGRYYLPIGSCVIMDKGHKALAVAPTMLFPQKVQYTNNAYYATMAVLYNILENKKENMNQIDILLTSFCCGYGKMQVEESVRQMISAIENYSSYTGKKVTDNILINEPNLQEQPKYYENMEFMNIRPEDVIRD